MKNFLAVCCLVLAATSGRAVIVAGDQAGHDANAPGVWGWDYTGSIFYSGGAFNASGVYLGNYGGTHWVLTAAHVTGSNAIPGEGAGLGTFNLGGFNYSFTGSGVRIKDPNTNLNVDLYLAPITSDAPSALGYLDGLTNLTIGGSTPDDGTQLTMIGSGKNRSDLTTYYVDTGTSPYVWSTTNFAQADAMADGYKWAGGNTKRWATNTVSGTMLINAGNGVTSVIITDFDEVEGEGQGSLGDSGGGVFTGSTTLSGIIINIGGYSGQPSQTAIFGNETYAADLSKYRSDIIGALVPEPGTFILLAMGMAMLLWGTRRGPRTGRTCQFVRVEARPPRPPDR